MIRDDQSSSSRMLSRAETDAINSILDEEEIRIGQFSSLSPNISALDEQCKQIWSNWESIPIQTTKMYNNNNDFNNSSPRIPLQTKPSTQFDIYDSVPKRTEKYKLSTPTSNKLNDFNDSVEFTKYNERPKTNKYDYAFSHQDYSPPSAQPRTSYGTKFETTARPPPSIDDIADFSTKPSPYTQRSPNYQESRNIDPLKNFATPMEINSFRRNQTDFDYQIPSKTSIKTNLIENDVGNLKNELNDLMAKVRTASRSPTSVNLNSSPTRTDAFSAKDRNFTKPQTSSQNYKEFASPNYQSSKPTVFNQQERYTSPKSLYTPTSNINNENTFTSSSSKFSSNRYSQKSYDIGMNDDSFIQRASLSTEDDNNNFAEPISISKKISSEPKLSPPFTSGASNLNSNANMNPSTNMNPNANQAPPSQPEILLLRQENVRLKAELLKVQKQLQAEHEEKENIKLSLMKCEQLRQRYKEKLKMYEQQNGVQQPQQQNK